MSAREKLVVANWKMNLTRATTRAWIDALHSSHVERPWPATTDVWVAPSFPLIAPVHSAMRGLPLRIAAQNCHESAFGAFTGEVSVSMLNDCGADAVIVGHSERRHLFGEGDQRIAKKVNAAIDAGLSVILCVGETESERDAEQMHLVLETQLRNGLGVTPAAGLSRVVVAYEPVWAIGTGRVADRVQVSEAHAFLRSIAAAAIGPEFATRCRLLYGGSVDPKNAPGLADLADVDGFLVGGASLDPGSFRRIIDAFG